MNIQGKVWGNTLKLFDKNNVSVHRIHGKKGGYCSKHKHEHKYNLLFVESGSLKIEIWKDYNLVDVTNLCEDQCCIIEPGQFHKFTVQEDAVVVEIYWTELCSKDIVRKDHGGFIN